MSMHRKYVCMKCGKVFYRDQSMLEYYTFEENRLCDDCKEERDGKEKTASRSREIPERITEIGIEGSKINFYPTELKSETAHKTKGNLRA